MYIYYIICIYILYLYVYILYLYIYIHICYIMYIIDMEVSNASFICKRCYATTLLIESGVIGTPSKTYKVISN